MKRKRDSLPLVMGKLTGENIVVIRSFKSFQLICDKHAGNMRWDYYEEDAKKLFVIMSEYLPYGTYIALLDLLFKESKENE